MTPKTASKAAVFLPPFPHGYAVIVGQLKSRSSKWLTRRHLTSSIRAPRFPPSWLRQPSRLQETRLPSQSDHYTDHYYGVLPNLSTTTSGNMLGEEQRMLFVNISTKPTSEEYKSLSRKG